MFSCTSTRSRRGWCPVPPHRIGRAGQCAERLDRPRALDHQGDQRAGGDELDERTVERLSHVLGVVRLGQSLPTVRRSMATIRSPLRSILARTSPIRPRRTPSGFIRTRVRSDNVFLLIGGHLTCEAAHEAGNDEHRLTAPILPAPALTGRLPPGQASHTPAAAPLASTDALCPATIRAPGGVKVPGSGGRARWRSARARAKMAPSTYITGTTTRSRSRPPAARVPPTSAQPCPGGRTSPASTTAATASDTADQPAVGRPGVADGDGHRDGQPDHDASMIRTVAHRRLIARSPRPALRRPAGPRPRHRSSTRASPAVIIEPVTSTPAPAQARARRRRLVGQRDGRLDRVVEPRRSERPGPGRTPRRERAPVRRGPWPGLRRVPGHHQLVTTGSSSVQHAGHVLVRADREHRDQGVEAERLGQRRHAGAPCPAGLCAASRSPPGCAAPPPAAPGGHRGERLR